MKMNTTQEIIKMPSESITRLTFTVDEPLQFQTKTDTAQEIIKMVSETIIRFTSTVDELCIRLEHDLDLPHDIFVEFCNLDDSIRLHVFSCFLEDASSLLELMRNNVYMNEYDIAFFNSLLDMFIIEYVEFETGFNITVKQLCEALNVPKWAICSFQRDDIECFMFDAKYLLLEKSSYHLILNRVYNLFHIYQQPAYNFPFTKNWLLRTGLESNPGPVASTLRHNRYSTVEPTKRERRALRQEIRCAKRKFCDVRAAKRDARTDLELNRAQLGASDIGIDIPQECSKCGKCKCDCMVKREEILVRHEYYASLIGLFTTLVGLLERVIALRAANRAQIGFSSLFSAPSLMSNMDNLAVNVNETIQNMPTAQGIADTVTQAVTQLMEKQCGFLPVSIKVVFHCFLTLIGVYILYHLGCISGSILALPLEFLFQGVGRINEIICTFRGFVKNCNPPKNTAHLGVEDVLESASEWSPKAMGLLGALISTFCLTKLPDKNNSPAQWLMRIGAFPRACTSFMEIVAWIEQAFKRILGYVKVKFFGHDPKEFEECIPLVKEWMTDVETFNHKPAFDAASTTKDGRFMMAHLYDKGARLMDKYAKALTPELKVFMMQKMREAAKIQTEVETQFPEVKNVRTVPIALWLVGESQIGKSRLQYFIANRLALEAGFTDVESQMYQRCVENVYWDGYNGQFVVVYDDFMQMRDTVGAPNLELFEFIRGIGPFPYALHMASISAKASTFFKSRVIIASTNASNSSIESITYPKAVWNRLEKFAYRVTVKDKYYIKDKQGNATNKIDWNLVEQDAPTTSDGKKWKVNPYIYNFTKFCPHTQRDRGAIGPPIGWDEYIGAVIAEMHGRKNDGDDLDGFLSQYVKDFRAGNLAHVGAQENETVVLMQEAITAQSGEVRSRTKMNEFFKFVENLPESEQYGCVSGSVLGIHLMMEREEMYKEELDFDKTDLDTYIPRMFPEDAWSVLIVRFYVDKYRPKSRVQKFLDAAKRAQQYANSKLPEQARAFLDFLTTATSSLMTKIKDFCAENPMISLIGFLGAAFLFKRNRNTTPEQRPPVIVTQPESDTRNMQPRLRQQVRKHNAARARIVAEMGQSMGQLDVIAKVRANQWHLSMVTQDNLCTSLGTITNIIGQVYMMPAHFYVFLQAQQPKEIIMVPNDNAKLRIVKSFDGWFEENSVVLFTPEETSDDEDPADICLFTLSKMPRGKSILHHFATANDLAKLDGAKFDGTLSGIDMENDIPVSTSAGGRCQIEDVKIVVNMPLGLESFDASHLVRHDIPTKVGDCGKLLSVNSDKIVGRIVGMHISGSPLPFSNFCQVVSRETIAAGLSLLPNFAQVACGLRELKPAQQPFETGLLSRGQADFVIPQVSKTSIVKSALYGMFGEVLTRPARLRPWKQIVDGQEILRDPLREGAAKQGRQCGYLTQTTLKDIECSMRALILPRNDRAPTIRLLTYEESVRGIEGDQLFQPINRLTSPGFPYILDARKRGCKGKTFWMGTDEWDFTSPAALELKRDVDNLELDLREDRPHEIIWVDTLKDERRSHSKWEAGKTRLISNGPMHYNVLFRKYFMAALAHLRHHRIDNGIAVGINTWGPEWHKLATYLRGTSDEMIDGDMTDFSDRLMDDLTWVNFNLLDEIYRVYDTEYTDDHRKIRRRLWEYASCAIRYNQGTIYQTTNGTPAGFVPTAENNSLYGLCAFRAAYLYLAQKYKPDMNDLKHFEQNVRVITYGDDNVLSINPTIREFFNMRNLVEAFASFGMIYTTADKGTDYDKRKTIRDVSFLKRYFALVKINGHTLPRYVCPAPLDTRLDMLNWTSDKHIDNLLEQSDLVTDVFKELAMHPQDVFEHWTSAISKRCYGLGINKFRLLPYHKYLEPFATGGSFLPRKCDLTVSRQITESNKRDCTAASGRGVCINTYTLGSPEAAPQNPRETRSLEMIESSL